MTTKLCPKCLLVILSPIICWRENFLHIRNCHKFKFIKRSKIYLLKIIATDENFMFDKCVSNSCHIQVQFLVASFAACIVLYLRFVLFGPPVILIQKIIIVYMKNGKTLNVYEYFIIFCFKHCPPLFENTRKINAQDRNKC